jgi:glycosyltransferase involved in cell wall biosynthesis
MKVAFYAPMKPPDHAVPSGDRAIARALVRAMRLAGHEVRVASRLRTFDRQGDEAVQRRHRIAGMREAQRLVARFAAGSRPDVWFTYHLHHKAPDCVGPHVARALGLPYVVAEASIAAKHAGGRWASGYATALDAIRLARTILFLNPADVPAVRAARAPGSAMHMLTPFIDVDGLAASPPCNDATRGSSARLVTVAMMREGGKLASYRVLAAALLQLPDLHWRLTIVGDGPARDDVVRAFAPLPGRVSFCGTVAPAAVAAILRQSDVFVWPAIDEAIGIAFLEAQACGLPVVAGHTPGVAGVVAHGETGLVAPAGDASAFAACVRSLLTDASTRDRMSHDAPMRVRAHHDVRSAARRLDAILRDTVNPRPTRGPPSLPPVPAAALP